ETCSSSFTSCDVESGCVSDGGDARLLARSRHPPRGEDYAHALAWSRQKSRRSGLGRAPSGLAAQLEIALSTVRAAGARAGQVSPNAKKGGRRELVSPTPRRSIRGRSRLRASPGSHRWETGVSCRPAAPPTPAQQDPPPRRPPHCRSLARRSCSPGPPHGDSRRSDPLLATRSA